MNESSAVRAGSWVGTIHTPRPVRRGDTRDHGVLPGRACELHQHTGQADAHHVAAPWAITWYRNIQSMTSRLGDGHVAA